MKRVVPPQQEPHVLTDFRSKHPNGTWDQFKRKRGRKSRAVFDSLRQSQGGICAYCEIDIERGDTGQVEHFVPKSQGGAHLEIRNLLAVCDGGANPALPERYEAPPEDTIHCGMLKDSVDPEGRIIDPRTLPEWTIWRVGIRGQMRPDRERCAAAEVSVELAESTLDGLGLNRRVLVRLRGAIREKLAGREYSSIERSELLSLRDGQLPAFYTTILTSVSP